jgi:hypothetical protein
MAHKQCIDRLDKRCDCIIDDLQELESLKKKDSDFPEFRTFNKISRLSRDIVITEKIDGSNGVIFIDDKLNILVSSRNRWLWSSIENNDIKSDNFGFGNWVRENQIELLKLGKGYHYGEFWGKGIQRGYGLLEKRFSLFNAGRWCLYNEEPKLISIDPKIEKYQERLPKCCYLVPILYEGIFNTSIISSILDELRIAGSKASPNFMNPEGVVIYHKAGNCYFKKTIENDEKGKDEIK